MPERQLINLKVARATTCADWFLHIDSDEFLHLEIGFDEIVNPLPLDVTEIRLQNFERIMFTDASTWHSGAFRVPCWDKVVLSNYPVSIHRFLGLGLANYYHGKSFVKHVPQLVQGIHGGLRKSEYEVIRFSLPWRSGFIGHFQYNGRESFYKRFAHKFKDREMLLKHELNQASWIVRNNFARHKLFQLGISLFEADEATADRYLQKGLFREIPHQFSERIENSFDRMHLRISK